MTIAASYNFTDSPIKIGSVEVQPFTTAPAATWVITGGTGAYWAWRVAALGTAMPR